ncbi:MAG: hypothetical protein PVG24_06210 [Gammaproteobacteria bacterium]|jgi:hypothetical protein
MHEEPTIYGRGGRHTVAGILLALSVAVALPPAVARADMDVDPTSDDERAGRSIEVPPSEVRESSKSKSRLDALRRQHDELQFKKRTKQSFTSDRSLRHQLRRNEERQGWEKSEQRRLEYERLRRDRTR